MDLDIRNTYNNKTEQAIGYPVLKCVFFKSLAFPMSHHIEVDSDDNVLWVVYDVAIVTQVVNINISDIIVPTFSLASLF